MWPVIMVEEKQRVLVRLLQALRYSVTSAFKNETLVSSPLRVIGENKLIKIASDSSKNFTYQRRFRPSYLVWVLTTTWAQFICLLGKTCKLMELMILCGNETITDTCRVSSYKKRGQKKDRIFSPKIKPFSSVLKNLWTFNTNNHKQQRIEDEISWRLTTKSVP